MKILHSVVVMFSLAFTSTSLPLIQDEKTIKGLGQLYGEFYKIFKRLSPSSGRSHGAFSLVSKTLQHPYPALTFESGGGAGDSVSSGAGHSKIKTLTAKDWNDSMLGDEPKAPGRKSASISKASSKLMTGGGGSESLWGRGGGGGGGGEILSDFESKSLNEKPKDVEIRHQQHQLHSRAQNLRRHRRHHKLPNGANDFDHLPILSANEIRKGPGSPRDSGGDWPTANVDVDGDWPADSGGDWPAANPDVDGDWPVDRGGYRPAVFEDADDWPSSAIKGGGRTVKKLARIDKEKESSLLELVSKKSMSIQFGEDVDNDNSTSVNVPANDETPPDDDDPFRDEVEDVPADLEGIEEVDQVSLDFIELLMRQNAMRNQRFVDDEDVESAAPGSADHDVIADDDDDLNRRRVLRDEDLERIRALLPEDADVRRLLAPKSGDDDDDDYAIDLNPYRLDGETDYFVDEQVEEEEPVAAAREEEEEEYKELCVRVDKEVFCIYKKSPNEIYS